MLLPSFVLAQKIGVFPYLIEPMNSGYNIYGDKVAELIIAKFHYSSTVDVPSLDQIRFEMTSLRINRSELNLQAVASISRSLNLDYVVAGSLSITEAETLNMRSKLIDTTTMEVINTAFDSKGGINQIYELVDSNISNLMEDRVSFDFSVTTGNTLSTRNVDLCFVLDQTNGLNCEMNLLTHNIRHIIQALHTMNIEAHVRVAIISYTTMESRSRIQVFPFSSNISSAEQYLITLRSGNEVQGTPAIHQALAAAEEDLDWSAQANNLRYIFLIADRGSFTNNISSPVIDTAQQLQSQNIRLFTLAGSQISEDMIHFLDQASESTDGDLFHLSYRISTYVGEQTKKNYIYQNHTVFEQIESPFGRSWANDYYMQSSNLLNISLGRTISSPEEVLNFLKNEGISIRDTEDRETQQMDCNVVENIVTILQNDYESQIHRYPVRTFRSNGIDMEIIIGNENAFAVMEELTPGLPVYLGGQIIAVEGDNHFGFKPSSLIIERDSQYIPALSIKSIQHLMNEPHFHQENGILEQPIWFIRATYVGE